MIGALWHRWFDSREHRRALRIAEQNHRDALILLAVEKRTNRQLRVTNARLAVLVDTCEKEHR